MSDADWNRVDPDESEREGDYPPDDHEETEDEE
jgi:hypothetical protein